ncbi:condensin-2 complex subunit D3-like isoform X3 [Acropora millepora]|uniref:condensin-2 complex subunit D3-like isoform X3 n=1 Tax=Acropora millepora TaxID=45264 RepID=UPI001CF19DB4|nr:condensin-2 complex subunit D3-like isoform X3 [Acropora millepora]
MASSRERIIQACNGLQVPAISLDWADQAWSSDFCEPVELPEILENRIVDCKYFVGDLQTLLVSLKHWSTRCNQSVIEGLWKVLSDNGLSHKVLISVLYSFIDSGDKSSHPGPKLESCIMAANIYIILIQVPVEKKRKRRNEATAGGRKAKARRGKANDHEDMETENVAVGGSDDDDDDDDDECDNDDDNDYLYGHMSTEEAKASIKVKLLSLMQDAVKLLQSYSLKDSEQVLEHVIQLFVETTRLEVLPLAEMTFDFPGDQIYSVKSIVLVAYIGLDCLCSQLHGDVGANTRTVFKHLISNFLMISGSSSVTSNGLVMRDVQTIKDQAIQFVNHITHKDNKDILSGVKVLVQVICTKCPERAEYRSVLAKAVVDIMDKLPVTLYASLVEWINKFSKNAKISYRIFALDLISLLLFRPEKSCPMEEHGTNENIKTLLSKTYLLDIVIARCSDRAPTVRAKALQYFAQCLTSEDSSLVVNIKAHLNEAIEKATDSTPTLTQTSGQQSESKGISAIIRQRTCDDKVGVRKAALEALESVIRLSLDSLQKEDVLTLHDRCMDPALSVRKQAMISLTALLQEKPSCTMVQSLWLDGVFPLVMDRETTAQEKCFQILDEVLLSNIAPQSKSTSDQCHVLAWDLLERIVSPAGQEVRRYLHFAFQHWAKQNRLSGNLIKSLVSQIDTGHSKAAWLCLAEIGSSTDRLDHSLVVKSWNDYSQGVRDCDSETLCRILSVLGSSAPLLPHSVVRTLTGDLHSKLISFECPPDVIASITATLCKLGKVHPLERGNSDQWCSDLLKASEEFLSQVMLTQDFFNEELLTRHLFTVGEVAQLAPSKTTERLFMFVESLLMSHNNKEDPLQKLNLSPPVKAHAFVTLGKLCLQNEDLAKQCIAALARELETSNDPAIRNNVIVVMCDLCVRYTSLVDRYIPNIAACLKDSAPLVRRQTLTLLTHLLQEDFVKWKGALFYRFITTLVDEDPEIWKFADFCLVHLLLSRHPGMLYQHFVECVFHFNSYEKHKVYNKFPQTDRVKKLFSLKGDHNASKRLHIYQFMLSHMGDEDKFNLTGKLCQEVLAAFTDDTIQLDQDSGAVLKDALLILSSKNIKLSSMRSKVAEELADEGDAAGAAIAQARNKFLTQVVKKNMIENIIPIIIELKHLLEKQHSPLLRDLMSCLKEVMKDYRTEVQDVLSADRQLANEIEFDLKRFEEQQKELEDQRRKQLTPGNSTQVCARSSQASGSTPAVQPEVFVTPQLRGATPSPKNGSNVTPLAGAINKMQIGRRHTLAADGQTMVPITNALTSKVRVMISPLQDKRRHTFVAPAIMRSARKAIDHAQKVTEQLRGSSSVPQVEVAKEDIAVTKGQQTRTPLKPVNPKVSQKQNEDRAASTPAGERSHLLRVSFFETNPSTAVPPSPIPTSLPIRVYANDKVTPPSWIESSDTEGNVGSEVEGKEQIICMMSPEQKLPQPRKWNVKSPEHKKTVSTRKTRSDTRNESIAGRTRSQRRK